MSKGGFITNGNGLGQTDVGTWYCTYYGSDWDHVLGNAYPPTLYRPLCSGRPGDFRPYRADDAAVIDYHLEQLSAARIDFIIFELTIGGLGGYVPGNQFNTDKARAVCARIKLWNERHDWRIKYAVAAGSHPDVYRDDPPALCMEREAQEVYETFYLNPDYGGPDNYYQLDGKPLLVYWGNAVKNPVWWAEYDGDKSFGSQFTMRYAQDIIPGRYGWNIYASGTALHPEVECVSPGWGHYWRKEPPYVARESGDFYQRCWNTVLDNPLPAIVMVVTFNDYLENTAVWTADTANLTDADMWVDHAGRLQPSLYWDLTVKNIQTLRSMSLR